VRGQVRWVRLEVQGLGPRAGRALVAAAKKLTPRLAHLRPVTTGLAGGKPLLNPPFRVVKWGAVNGFSQPRERGLHRGPSRQAVSSLESRWTREYERKNVAL
jgi:hypothetical protein